MDNTEIKKEYVKPEMKIINMEFETSLLCSSSNNPYWNGCHEGWQGSWGDDDE